MPLKVYIETIGCKLNQFESQALKENLTSQNFIITDSLDDADCTVINTCSVTGRADKKSIQAMKRAKKMGKIVLATGCYVTTDLDKIKNAGYADYLVRNNEKFSIPEILKRSPEPSAEISCSSGTGEFPIVRHFDRTRAFVKIQDGCDKLCTYCKIPRARGKSRCLPADEAAGFARDLVGRGYREIVLTGVNISGYRSGDSSLYELVLKILSIKGDFRVRLSSLQPDEFDPRIIDLLDTGKLSNHFHLSAQSGSGSVLKRMGRFYTPDQFFEIACLIKEKDPSCGITTDIIAGFPGETDIEFDETLKFVDKVGFSRAHIFPYSPRTGTAAFRMNDMPSKIKKERVRVLEESVFQRAAVFAERSVIGRSFPVLLETIENGEWTGYTSNYIRIRTAAKGARNTFVNVVPGGIVKNGVHMELYDGAE